MKEMRRVKVIITLLCVLVFLFKPSNSLKFPAILIFGDSTVDTGNNDYIVTLLKANHYPYGKDFPGHVGSGRFCNGKLISDMAASYLGIKQAVPPFLDTTLSDYELRTGVSFASAGSGYDRLTTVASKVIPVLDQVHLFKSYIRRLNQIVGVEEAKKIVGNAFVLISAGTNDFNINFYDLPTRRLQFSISQYQDFLQNIMQNFIQDLYSLGCRNFMVVGLPPIGCLPIQMSLKYKIPSLFRCIEDQNSDSQAYNNKLLHRLPKIQASLPGSKVIYADFYSSLIDMIRNPSKYGFEETKVGCCGTGFLETGPLCNARTPLCHDDSQYLFWDSIHPSESAYKAIFDSMKKTIKNI